MPAPECEKGAIKRICSSVAILPNSLVIICHVLCPALGWERKVVNRAAIIPAFMDSLVGYFLFGSLMGFVCHRFWWMTSTFILKCVLYSEGYNCLELSFHI